MAKLAVDVMTPDPACCRPTTTLDLVAKMMAQNDCGEIPVVDIADHPIGVITDRDIVCRVVAEGMNPMGHTVEAYMTQPVVTVRVTAPVDEVVGCMARHRVRRVPVVDDRGCLVGIVAQADLAEVVPPETLTRLWRAVSDAPPRT
jgi:CBS domain-containing protein